MSTPIDLGDRAVLERLLAGGVTTALAGELTDKDRLAFYRLALIVATGQLERLALERMDERASVSLELVKQICTVCDGTEHQIRALLQENVENAEEGEPDIRPSVEDADGLRGVESGSPESDEEDVSNIRSSSDDGDETP